MGQRGTPASPGFPSIQTELSHQPRPLKDRNLSKRALTPKGDRQENNHRDTTSNTGQLNSRVLCLVFFFSSPRGACQIPLAPNNGKQRHEEEEFRRPGLPCLPSRVVCSWASHRLRLCPTCEPRGTRPSSGPLQAPGWARPLPSPLYGLPSPEQAGGLPSLLQGPPQGHR